MTCEEVGGKRRKRESRPLPALDPKDPEIVRLQLFLVYLSALLKVLTRHGPGQGTPNHVAQAHDELVVKTCTGYSTSDTSEKRLTPRGTQPFMRTHVQA